MRILFSNDDGYDAIGIQSLYHAFKDSYDSYLCAPLTHKSAFSHAINYKDPLEVKKLEGNLKGFALDSTPADCMRAALHGLFPEKFDLVLSGINYGINAAQDIFYSGTVAAAREASFNGLMTMAISLDIPDFTHVINDEVKQTFEYAAKITKRIVDDFPKELLNYKGSVININFPALTPAKGIKLTTLGQHGYITKLIHSSQDDKDFIHINTTDKNICSGEGTDVYHLNNGFIVVTALHKGIIYDEILQSQLEFIQNINISND